MTKHRIIRFKPEKKGEKQKSTTWKYSTVSRRSKHWIIRLTNQRWRSGKKWLRSVQTIERSREESREGYTKLDKPLDKEGPAYRYVRSKNLAWLQLRRQSTVDQQPVCRTRFAWRSRIFVRYIHGTRLNCRGTRGNSPLLPPLQLLSSLLLLSIVSPFPTRWFERCIQKANSK